MNDKLEHKALVLKNSSKELEECDGSGDNNVVSDELFPGDGDVSEENLETIENEMQIYMEERRNFMKDVRNTLSGLARVRRSQPLHRSAVHSPMEGSGRAAMRGAKNAAIAEHPPC